MAGIYFLTVIMTDEQLEDGPVVTSPLGGVSRYETMEEAGDAARQLVAGGTVRGAFVQKLVPVALYTPTTKTEWAEPVRPEGN